MRRILSFGLVATVLAWQGPAAAESPSTDTGIDVALDVTFAEEASDAAEAAVDAKSDAADTTPDTASPDTASPDTEPEDTLADTAVSDSADAADAPGDASAETSDGGDASGGNTVIPGGGDPKLVSVPSTAGTGCACRTFARSSRDDVGDLLPFAALAAAVVLRRRR